MVNGRLTARFSGNGGDRSLLAASDRYFARKFAGSAEDPLRRAVLARLERRERPKTAPRVAAAA